MKFFLLISWHVVKEYLTLFPVILLLTALFVPSPLEIEWLVTVFLLYVLGLCFGRISGTKKRWIHIGFSLLCAVIVTWLFYSTIISGVALFLIGGIAAFRGIQYSYIERQLLLPIHFQWSFGVSFYFIGYFLFKYIESLAEYNTFITASGLIFLVILLFVSNADHLQQATLAKKPKNAVNKVIQKQNRLYVVVTLGAIFLLTQFGTIKSLLSFVISALLKLISDGSPIEEPLEQGPEEKPINSVQEIIEPSIYVEILEMVATVIAFIFLIIGIGFFLYKISKHFRYIMQQIFQIIHKLITFFGKKSPVADSSETYNDEKETLFDLSNWRKKVLNQTKTLVKRTFSREKRWEELSAVDQIRLLYRKLIIKARRNGYTFKKSETAHECLSRIDLQQAISKEKQEHLDKLYNQARYSNKKMSELSKDGFIELLNEK
ncbi:hypothetical protein GCM10011351_02140 [Paraliobacillus quinghaiensis]|uniref:DUF4129 domain-containing protein n=1 Tax=Paraliobacillus quinghaiensis TaxID=470815 RepID=A0A917WQ25_9BACI|nr:APC family permease [Paraliobacillus quinghaiensis]GGM19848.1 hypothetical protein GCM10011351_02140 [Paraliobacillus quinghaiensis]